MQPNRQFNQAQTYGVYFSQSAAQPYQHHPVGAPTYQTYGSGATQYYQGQPVVQVTARYPHLMPYQHNTSQNYGGQPYVGFPPPKPFPEQNVHHPPPLNHIGQPVKPFPEQNLQHPPQLNSVAQSVRPFPEQNFHRPPPLNPAAPQPPTPPASLAVYTSPVSQGATSPYAWSTAVTPPSPMGYFNQDRTPPAQQCSIQPPLPPRLKMLGQFMAQSQKTSAEMNNDFNADPSSLERTTLAGNDNKDVFKQKASQCGIFIQSPPKPEDIESHLPDSRETDSDIRKYLSFNKPDTKKNFPEVTPSKASKRPRDDDTETKIRIPTKTVVDRTIGEQKVDDWWSVSDTSNLSGTPFLSRNDCKAFSDLSLNDSNTAPDISTYSSFPDSSVDISKVLAESSVSANVDNSANEVFDDSVDYIEEHEFLSYDVTTSPFPLIDSDDNENYEELLENKSCEEFPEDPYTNIQGVSNKSDLEIEQVISIDNKNQETVDKNISLSLANRKSSTDYLKSDDGVILLRYFQQLQQSETKKNEILGLGEKSDENMEKLASAIVSSAIAKAVIDMIGKKGINTNVIEHKESVVIEHEENIIVDEANSVDVNRNTNAETIETKENVVKVDVVQKESIAIVDKESSVDGNWNADAETVDTKTVTQNRSESFEKATNTGGRCRLYSWPYSSDTDTSFKAVGENHAEKQTNVTKKSVCAKHTEDKINVDSNVNSQREEFSSTVQTKVSDDFEKFYFKQKASQHGIEIVSPLKRASSLSSESDSENGIHHRRTEKQKQISDLFDISRSQSESSDLHSLDGSDAQIDPSYVFKQKASKLGIKIQNPKQTIELSAENSDAELETYAVQNKADLLHDLVRPDTSTPEPEGLPLNPESPEFKPGWKRKIENRQGAVNSMRPDAPEFNPDAWNTRSSDLNDSLNKIEMRAEAPEFKPENSFDSSKMRVNAPPFDPLKTAGETVTKVSKVFHIPTPKPKEEKPAIGIQASPETSDSSVNTRRLKTKDTSMSTGSCESRDVCVNTEFSGNQEAESHTLPTKQSKSFASKNTNTDVPRRRSIAVSANISGGYHGAKMDEKQKTEDVVKLERDQAAMHEQIRSLQVEVMKHRANLHMTRIFLMEHNIQKEAKALIDNLRHWPDKNAENTIWSVADAKLNSLQATIERINAVSGDAITKIRSGVVLKTLPDFSFYSENVEQNRVIANEELFKVATGSSVVAEQQPIKIDFSPTNQNLIRFTAKSSEDRSPANVNRSPVKNNIPTTTDSAVQACLGLVGATVTSVKSPLKKEMGTQAVVEMVHLDQRTTEHVEEKSKDHGSLMDLDLDSDDDVTEVSTALVDDDDACVTVQSNDEESKRKYTSDNKELKDLISSKMNEVYGALSGHESTNLAATGDIKNEFNEIAATKDSDFIVKSNIITCEIHNLDDIDHTERKLDSKTSEMKNENLVSEDKVSVCNKSDHSVEKNIASEVDIKTDGSKQRQKLVEGKDAVNIKEKNDTKPPEAGIDKAHIVTENKENVEVDLDGVYASRDIHITMETKSAIEDVGSSHNLLSDEQVSLAEVPKSLAQDKHASEVNSEKCGTLSQVSTDTSVCDLKRVPSPSEAEFESVLKESESEFNANVSASINSSNLFPSSSVALTSAVSLVSSVNNGLPSSMPLMQSVGNNIPPPPVLMNNLDPILYQLVVAQLIKAYPDLTANPDMLSSVAVQQTNLLQFYIASGQISGANFAGTDLQGGSSVMAMLGNVGQGMIESAPQIPVSETGQNKNNSSTATNQSTNIAIEAENNSLKAASNESIQLTDRHSTTSSDLGTSVQANGTSIDTKIKPLPYKPPGLRGQTAFSDSNNQSKPVSKVNSSASKIAEKSFSAVKRQTLPDKSLDSVHGTRSVTSNSRAKTSNSVSRLNDCDVPLRRPFTQTVPVSKSLESVQPTTSIVTNSRLKTCNSVNDCNVPMRRPFTQSIPISKSFESVQPTTIIATNSIPDSNSLISGFSSGNEPLRRPLKKNYIPVSNVSTTSNLPVSFSSVTNSSNQKLGANQSDTMQGFKPINPGVSQFQPVNSVVNQSVNEAKDLVRQSNTIDSAKKPPDFLPQYAKRHSPELRDKINEPSSRDFLPSFVKQGFDENRNNQSTISNPNGEFTWENHQNYQHDLPPRFRRMSAPQRQSSTEEDWNDEIDEFPETKKVKFNPKRQLRLRSSSSRSPVPTDALLNSGFTGQKNQYANSTNPLLPRSTSVPGEFKEGMSGLSDIPLSKKLRTCEEKTDIGEKEEEKEEEWCEVTTKKKKQKELKKFSAPYLNSAPIPSLMEKQLKQSNFERLVEKIAEKNSSANRSEVIESISKLREQKGGNLKGMSLQEIVSQACNLLEQHSKPAKIPGLWTSQRATPPKLNLPAPNTNSTMVCKEDDEICVICHDPLSMEETKVLDCRHAFHSECINQWVYGRERTCPTCRQHALFPEEFPRLGK